ncbi:hypothetical protein CK203_077447 [Vitis vinifera]|uniref:Uncharacterized protein n=1 Tax=Vitis vinifera TaxID=29760 RepID=A0A438D209_VITVI|nr:hypothetical protein CK203_077447 [Vitis vinifera]
MLYSLDLTLLEVFFVYSLKKAKNDIFSVSAHLPSLQMVTELPDSTKGGAKGLVAVWGGWAGLSQHPSRPFSPNYTLKIPGLELRGHLVDWVEKASFACEYVINILPRKLAKDEIVPGEHYTVKELPLYQEAKEADAERRRKLLEDRDQKKTEGTIRKAPGQKRGPDPPQRKLQEKGGSWSFLSRGCASGNVAEEAASINHPGNLNPDADAAETAPLEEAGAESQSQPSDDPDRLAIVLVKGPPLKKPRLTRDLQSGLFERLQERQQEIEISCASAHDAHPDGGEVEMATETSAAPAIIPAEDASGPMSGRNMGAPIPGQSYPLLPHLRRNLLMMPLPLALSATRRASAACLNNTLFTQLLQTADYMRTFSSRHQEIENQLRLRMEEAEASLSTMREENEALRVELAEAKGREESTAGRLHEAEGEAARLRDELSRLRTEVLNEKKQKEDLQLRLDVQKEELEREFAVEREELAADYQKQVDDTFIFGYRCCMKKNKSEIPLQFLQVKKRSSMRNLLPDSLSLFAIFLL